MATTLRVLLFIFVLHGAQLAAEGCSNVTSLSAALDTLLAEYEREAAPAERVSVELTLDVRHAAVLEPAAAVRLLADLRMSWQDSRLAWNAPEWGCDSALVSAERLWRPDVALVTAGSVGAGDAPLRARLDSDGSVAWIARLDLSVPVALRLEAWPRDVQTVVVRFASRDHTVDELDVTVKDLKFATVFESGAWEIVQLSGAPWVARGAAGGERGGAAWSLALRRRAPAHALAAHAVLAAAALLLLSAALLPPQARAPLLACASFTAALWLTSALVRLPSGGAGAAPRVLALMCALCVCGGAACAGAALVQRLARLAGPAPAPLRALLARTSAVFELTPHEGSPESGAASWAAAARLLDYVLLAGLTLTVFVVGCLAV